MYFSHLELDCCWVALEPIPRYERNHCNLELPAHEAEGHHSHEPVPISFQNPLFYEACRGSGRGAVSQLPGVELRSSVWERGF